MSAYQYLAINQSGKETKGVIEADSLKQARSFLRDKGLLPTEVTLLKKSPQIKSSSKLSADELALITRQLATLLAAAIPVEEALRGVSEQSEKPKCRAILMGVRSKVLEGYSLAQALGEFPQAFPEIYCATIASGEQTGRLDLILEKLALYTESQQKTRQKVQQALIYPSIMIIVSVTIVCFLLAFVVPKIIEVFSSSGQTLPIMTVVLIFISHFVQSRGIYLLILIILFFISFKWYLKNPMIKMRWHRLCLKLPIVSYLIKSVNVSRYIHTFGILFASGVSVLETMRVSASVVNNLVIREAFESALSTVREGGNISHVLKETRFLSPMTIHLIASGEKSGKLAEMMERAANHMDNEVQQMIDTALTLLEPLVILIMGAVVLFIVLATLLPIFSMEQLIG